MSGMNCWGTRPMDVIAAAKARARAALREKDPKLTVLERSFYEIYKKHGG